MKQPASEQMADRMEQLAGRTHELADGQREVESELYSALSEAMQSRQQRDQIDPRRAQLLVEKKQAMANELSAVQREMRDVMNDQRPKHPQATQQLGEALQELEDENLAHRLNRSAAEIRYGRAREAAPREGLIAAGLDALERNLRVTAQMAATEADNQDPGQTGPGELLAELSTLRHALQEAQRRNEATQVASQAQSSQQPADSPGDQSLPNSRAPGTRNGEAQADGGDRGGAPVGLNAWSPSVAHDSLNPASADLETGAGQFRRETMAASERVRDLTKRMGVGELSSAQIQALRRMAHELRRLAGDPMASRSDAMSKLVDQIELATLAATQKSRNAAAHTSAVTADVPEYREATAEYYRKLGGG
jgi:hypothetical protein